MKRRRRSRTLGDAYIATGCDPWRIGVRPQADKPDWVVPMISGAPEEAVVHTRCCPTGKDRACAYARQLSKGLWEVELREHGVTLDRAVLAVPLQTALEHGDQFLQFRLAQSVVSHHRPVYAPVTKKGLRAGTVQGPHAPVMYESHPVVKRAGIYDRLLGEEYEKITPEIEREAQERAKAYRAHASGVPTSPSGFRLDPATGKRIGQRPAREMFVSKHEGLQKTGRLAPAATVEVDRHTAVEVGVRAGVYEYRSGRWSTVTGYQLGTADGQRLTLAFCAKYPDAAICRKRG